MVLQRIMVKRIWRSQEKILDWKLILLFPRQEHTAHTFFFMVELNKEINFLLECKYDNFVIILDKIGTGQTKSKKKGDEQYKLCKTD